MTPSSRSPHLSPAQRIHRTRARSWVLQILYAWESHDDPTSDPASLESVMDATKRARRIAPQRVPLVERHVDVLSRNLDEIDSQLRAALDNWRLERLSRVDRCVLRLAAGELLFMPDVPPKVAIQEGVRIAGQYGGNDSARFVNGVLDAVYRAQHTGP